MLRIVSHSISLLQVVRANYMHLGKEGLVNLLTDLQFLIQGYLCFVLFLSYCLLLFWRSYIILYIYVYVCMYMSILYIYLDGELICSAKLQNGRTNLNQTFCGDSDYPRREFRLKRFRLQPKRSEKSSFLVSSEIRSPLLCVTEAWQFGGRKNKHRFLLI